MRDTTRLTFEYPTELLDTVDEVARERGVSRTSLLRQGLGVMMALHSAKKDGLFAGLTRDRDKLDTLIVPVL